MKPLRLKEESMNTFAVAELKEGMFFTAEVQLDNTFSLLNPMTPIKDDLIKALLDWNFKEVYSPGVINTAGTPVQQTSDGMQGSENNASPADTLRANIEQITQNEDGSKSKYDIVKLVYNEYLVYINAIYTRYATHRELNYKGLYEIIKDLCIFVNQNRRYILRISPAMDPESKDFLVYHSMRSTIFAIVIGIQLKIPLSKLTEIGVACVVHEIGMIKLPPQYYMTNRILTPAEKKTIYTHPVLSYDIVKSYNFPLGVSLAVLEHHEKEDGSGYPRKLEGKDISLYAKIISIACSFEAITAPRHHRSAQSSHEAMVEMLKNTGKQYDETVIKALLYSMSLFPIGSYVFLADGRVGLIADTNPEDPKNPIVQLINEKTETGADKFVKSGTGEIKIKRVLTKAETEEFLKTLEPKDVPSVSHTNNDDDVDDIEELEELEEI